LRLWWQIEPERPDLNSAGVRQPKANRTETEIENQPDISVNQVAVPGVDSFHLDRRVQRRHNYHDSQREQGNEQLGPDFEIR
jgi:hypothetical protein